MELIAVFQLDVFHTLETPSEIEVPITATELTIGDHLQAGGQLALDEGGDALVFYLAEGGGVDFAGGITGAGFVRTAGRRKLPTMSARWGADSWLMSCLVFVLELCCFDGAKVARRFFYRQILSAIQKNILLLPHNHPLFSKSFGK